MRRAESSINEEKEHLAGMRWAWGLRPQSHKATGTGTPSSFPCIRGWLCPAPRSNEEFSPWCENAKQGLSSKLRTVPGPLPARPEMSDDASLGFLSSLPKFGSHRDTEADTAGVHSHITDEETEAL